MATAFGQTFKPAYAGDNPTVYPILFANNVHQVAEQSVSRLLPYVQRDSIVGGETKYYPIIDELSGHTNTGAATDTPPFSADTSTGEYQRSARYQQTVLRYIPIYERQLIPEEWTWATWVERNDPKRINFDINGQFTKSASASLGRRIDKIIIAALDGDVNQLQKASGATTGSRASTTYDWSTYGTDIDDGTPMDVNVLRKAKRILDEAEVPDEGRVCVCAAKQFESLLGITQVTSSDYNTVKALVQGDINTFLGFTFIRSELLGTSAAKRKCFCFQRDALMLGVEEQLFSSLDTVPLYNHVTQLYLALSMGCIRMEEDRVVRVLCTE